MKYLNYSENYIEFLERRINERNDITESTRKSHRVLISSLKEFGGITYISDLTVQNISCMITGCMASISLNQLFTITIRGIKFISMKLCRSDY